VLERQGVKFKTVTSDNGPEFLLHCRNNWLTSLPALPEGLRDLSCTNNQLTSLPALPTSLNSLFCTNNMITGIDLTGLNLQFFECDYNNMASPSDVIGSK